MVALAMDVDAGDGDSADDDDDLEPFPDTELPGLPELGSLNTAPHWEPRPPSTRGLARGSVPLGDYSDAVGGEPVASVTHSADTDSRPTFHDLDASLFEQEGRSDNDEYGVTLGALGALAYVAPPRASERPTTVWAVPRGGDKVNAQLTNAHRRLSQIELEAEIVETQQKLEMLEEVLTELDPKRASVLSLGRRSTVPGVELDKPDPVSRFRRAAPYIAALSCIALAVGIVVAVFVVISSDSDGGGGSSAGGNGQASGSGGDCAPLLPFLPRAPPPLGQPAHARGFRGKSLGETKGSLTGGRFTWLAPARGWGGGGGGGGRGSVSPAASQFHAQA